MCRRILSSFSFNGVRQSQRIASSILYPSIGSPLHTDAKKLSDGVKETNPFFDKYKEKIDKVGGYVLCVQYCISLTYILNILFSIERSVITSVPKPSRAQYRQTASDHYPYAESPVSQLSALGVVT